MAIKTYTEQLEEVQTAIAAVESGAQMYQLNGRMVTRGSLSTLYKREEYLRKMVTRESRGGARVRGVSH